MKALVIQGGGQRIGQQIFNFLEWLNKVKDIGTNQCGRIADPFFIEDEKLIAYWKEYNSN